MLSCVVAVVIFFSAMTLCFYGRLKSKMIEINAVVEFRFSVSLLFACVKGNAHIILTHTLVMIRIYTREGMAVKTPASFTIVSATRRKAALAAVV